MGDTVIVIRVYRIALTCFQLKVGMFLFGEKADQDWPLGMVTWRYMHEEK